MNAKLLLIAISVAAFSSCTTLYKAGQTPDDVYYSPARPMGVADNIKEQRRDDGYSTVYNNNYYAEDRMIRFGINDRRWRYFDYDYDYAYNPYNYGFNYGYYYNPYFWPYPVYSSSFVTLYSPKNTTPRMANLSGYNPVYNLPVNTNHGGIGPVRTYNNTNRGSAFGNAIRQVFTPANSSNNPSYNNNTNNNTRTYTPATTNSSSSSSGSRASSGSGSISRPPR